MKLTDKRNGKIYNDLNGIKDDGEVGDGLAFVSANGLHKGGCDNDEASTINVTLYRCFDRVFMQCNAKETSASATIKLQLCDCATLQRNNIFRISH